MTVRSIALLAALTGCSTAGTLQTDSGRLDTATAPDTGAASAPDAELLTDPRLADLAASGAIDVDLGDGRGDPTVVADATEVLVAALDGIVPLDFSAGHHIGLTYLGKGNLTAEPETDDGASDFPEGQDADPTAEPGPGIEGIDAFNLATRNEFRLVFSADLLAAIGEHDADNRLDLGSGSASETEDAASTPPPAQGPPQAWSNDDDDRIQIYADNSPVTVAAHQRLVQLGGGCSGTLVGPRHVVTAGHCLWDRDTQTWSNRFWVRAGANGTTEEAEVFVDADNIPAGTVLWYYTPSEYRATTGSTWGFDYGILTIPSRLGDVVGWMGRVTYDSDALQSAYIYRRGYPQCVATLKDGTPRIDEPVPCMPNHLFGNTADCSVGEFESQDADGWSRVIHHSCDASAADSGSGLYVYHNGVPAVTAVHFVSRCETTANSTACTGSLVDRPLGALRLTPTYRDLIGAFRSLYP